MELGLAAGRGGCRSQPLARPEATGARGDPLHLREPAESAFARVVPAGHCAGRGPCSRPGHRSPGCPDDCVRNGGRIVRPGTGPVATTPDPLVSAMASAAFRRIARPEGPLARHTAAAAAIAEPLTSVRTTTRIIADRARRSAGPDHAQAHADRRNHVPDHVPGDDPDHRLDADARRRGAVRAGHGNGGAAEATGPEPDVCPGSDRPDRHDSRGRSGGGRP